MNVEVGLSIQCRDEWIPDALLFKKWCQAALEGRMTAAEVSISVINIDDMTALNQQYRSKEGPTNVLSFPQEPESWQSLPVIGDVVICSPVLARQAKEQNKPLEAVWAHLTVHSVLHLLGFDHEQSAQAQVMEQLEHDILTAMNYPAPYGDTRDEGQ